MVAGVFVCGNRHASKKLIGEYYEGAEYRAGHATMVEREDEFIGMQAAGPGADFAGGWQCSACRQQVADSAVACPRDGTRKLSALEDDPQFHGYKFIGAIGAGGMGVIYKARHVSLNKIVAIKMLHPYLVSTDAVQRFKIEGQAVNKLDHPFIIKVH
ncbi:MAG TPA: hypothetical protein V6C69_20265, partial [Trichormus sp.]